MSDAKQILVIDDDPDTIDFCRTVLQSKGYGVLAATDGASGAEMARREAPDLIILDIMLERQDTGLKLAHELGRTAPVILFSNIASALDQVFDTGTLQIQGMVNKPVKPDALLEKVRRAIGP